MLDRLEDDGGELILYVDDIARSVTNIHALMELYVKKPNTKTRAELDRTVTNARSAVNKYNKEAELASEQERAKYSKHIEKYLKELEQLRTQYESFNVKKKSSKNACQTQ
jgi:predicted nucleotidyltransferase